MMFADETADGACHADDKSYLFKTAMGRVPESGTKEYQAMQRFVCHVNYVFQFNLKIFMHFTGIFIYEIRNDR